MFTINKEQAYCVLLGGALFGAGGGGLLKFGIEVLDTVFSLVDQLTYLDPEDLDDEDIVISTAMVGAPSSPRGRLEPSLWKKSLEAFRSNYEGSIRAIAANELGASASSNGWILSALTGIPLCDAPCVPRAVPYTPMCCLGLDQIPGFVSLQSACRGSSEQDYFQICCKGELTEVSAAIRSACANADGAAFGVIRNPVTARYHLDHAAPGVTRMLLKIGNMMKNNMGNAAAIRDALIKDHHFRFILSDRVEQKTICNRNGYDTGSFSIDGHTVLFWNEFMLVEKNGERLVSFPDPIIALDAVSGMPVTSAEMQQGQQLILLTIETSALPGASVGIRTEAYMREIEKALDRDIVSYYHAALR